MKRTFLAIVLAIFCGSSMFAQDQQRQEFLDKLMASVNHCREMLHAGQHKEAIAPITDLIAFLDTTTIYKARVVTCLPADPNDYECHVINAVYSETLNKWLYIDPTMDAWVMDENGTMLSIAEVRERLINDQPLVLCETANWNHENPQSKEYYLETYMAKNLYYFVCKNRSCFNQESIYYDTQNEDVRLIPAGFVNDNFGKAATTTNPDIFWANPN